MSTTELKAGQIVENYQGKFAKVLNDEGNGRYALTAWVPKKEDAEKQTTAVHFLNTFGLSQVLKGGANTPGAEKTAPEKKAPKKEAKEKAE